MQKYKIGDTVKIIRLDSTLVSHWGEEYENMLGKELRIGRIASPLYIMEGHRFSFEEHEIEFVSRPAIGRIRDFLLAAEREVRTFLHDAFIFTVVVSAYVLPIAMKDIWNYDVSFFLGMFMKIPLTVIVLDYISLKRNDK